MRKIKDDHANSHDLMPWYKRNKLKKLGLTPDEVRDIAELLLNDGRCEICAATENLHIDHNHKTNQFRGLLCRYCNTGLGSFKDNPRLLIRAAIYLHKKRS